MRSTRTGHLYSPALGLLAIGTSLVLAAPAGAAGENTSRLIMTGPDTIAAPDLKWFEPKSIPPGTRMLMVYGSPDQPGPYVFRVQFPAGYKLPAHRHPDERSVTVLQGNYWSGVGETFQQDKLRKFGPRDYYVTAPGAPHFSWAETDVIIQEMGIGPVSNPIQYVNPAEDPRK